MVKVQSKYWICTSKGDKGDVGEKGEQGEGRKGNGIVRTQFVREDNESIL